MQLAETVDRDRAAFIKQYFGIDWPARHFFHLMIEFHDGRSSRGANGIRWFESDSKRLTPEG